MTCWSPMRRWSRCTDCWRGAFSGTRKNSSPAAMKLHLVMSARGTGAHKVKVTGERGKRPTARCRWGRGSRGACCSLTWVTFATNSLMRLTETADTSFTRLATNADPCIVATHRQWRGRSIELEGKRLKEVAGRLKRDVLDVEVEVVFKRRVYGGIRRTARRRLRLVAVRLPESSDYRFLTSPTSTPNRSTAHAIAQTYAARWQIELIFKELKSHYRLEELPTRKAHIVETLLLGAVITLARQSPTAPCRAGAIATHAVQDARTALGLRIFAAAAPTILDIVVLPPRVSKVIATGASNRCSSTRHRTRIGPGKCSSNASNLVSHGHDPMQFNVLTRSRMPTGAGPRSPRFSSGCASAPASAPDRCSARAPPACSCSPRGRGSPGSPSPSSRACPNGRSPSMRRPVGKRRRPKQVTSRDVCV